MLLGDGSRLKGSLEKICIRFYKSKVLDIGNEMSKIFLLKESSEINQTGEKNPRIIFHLFYTIDLYDIEIIKYIARSRPRSYKYH